MIVFKKANGLSEFLQKQAQKGKKIGFVPTMGALHNGHISLIQSAKKDNTLTVASIFVNPTQFNNPSDYNKYPVTIDNDILLLETFGCDILFLPSVQEMYPEGTAIKNEYELGYLEQILEGKYRPGHFQGVSEIVDRLLRIVNPDHLYIGQKDYQQCMVIAKLIAIMGKTDEINLHICPTLREESGLAMSSRNMRLSANEKQHATLLWQTLLYIRENIKSGDIHYLKEKATAHLSTNGFKVDYVEIANAQDLSPVHTWDGKEKLVALVAAFLNEVRLIDNILLNEE